MCQIKKDRPISQYAALIDEWIFSRIDRIILKMKLLDNECFSDISEKVCLSIDQTKRRFYNARKELDSHI